MTDKPKCAAADAQAVAPKAWEAAAAKKGPKWAAFGRLYDSLCARPVTCREVAWRCYLAALAQQDAQAVPQWANAAFTEIAGCFDAAIAEGLLDALAETRDERLKDLVVRRLMYAHAVAAQAAAPTLPAQRVMLTDEEIGAAAISAGCNPERDDGALVVKLARAVIEAYEQKNGLKP